MGSEPSQGYYDEQSLRAIEGVFHEICEELAKSRPIYGCDNDTLRGAVVQRLLKLVERGITDSVELKTATLSYFDANHTPETAQMPLALANISSDQSAKQ